MEQIIKVYKSEKDFAQGKSIEDFPAYGNHDADYAKTFVNDFLRGVACGAKVKYAHPIAACWEVMDDGTERFVNLYKALL